MAGFGSSPRERFVWGVLIAGLMAVVLVAGLSRSRSGGTELQRLGRVPPFALTDQDGNPMDDTHLHGEVWMADFVFTGCRGLCPMLTQQMKDTAAALQDEAGWRMVSFSVDPAHDTPEVLAAYAREHGVDTGRWTFLTGPTETVRDLSTQGFHLAVDDAPPGEGDPILHSQSIVLVDREGEIRGYYDALDPDEMARLPGDAMSLLAESR